MADTVCSYALCKYLTGSGSTEVDGVAVTDESLSASKAQK